MEECDLDGDERISFVEFDNVIKRSPDFASYAPRALRPAGGGQIRAHQARSYSGVAANAAQDVPHQVVVLHVMCASWVCL